MIQEKCSIGPESNSGNQIELSCYVREMDWSAIV